MTILLRSSFNADLWGPAMRAALPDDAVVEWPDIGDPTAVEFAVVWNHDWADLQRYPNLRAVLITGAGFDHVDLDALPDVPVVRLADPAMSTDIAEYCHHWVTRIARRFDTLASQQQRREWRTHPVRQLTVAVLGLGTIGTVVGHTLADAGHTIVSWGRTPRETPFGTHHVGSDGLQACLAEVDVAVNLLPLDDESRGLLDTGCFTALGDGWLINVGRGGTVDESALLAALNGPMGGAVLDVFPVEPLPADSPWWSHPKVVVTPHVAGETNPHTAAPIIAANIRRIRVGDTPFPLVERPGA